MTVRRQDLGLFFGIVTADDERAQRERLRIKLAMHVARMHGGIYVATCPFVKALRRMGICKE